MYCSDDVRKTCEVMFAPGSVYEMRVPKTNQGVATGFYTDRGKLCQHAEQLSGKVPAVYVTLNPVDPALLSRADNKLVTRSQTTADTNIVRRMRLLVDCDPVRKAGISSTDAEHDAALDRARVVKLWLQERGFPDPLVADSGNGGHLVYALDMPNNDESTALVSQFLTALDARFSDSAVTVDTTVSNASRITKLYGTMACKGENTYARPHRLSRILEAPERLSPVPVDMLAAVAAESAPKVSTTTAVTVAVEATETTGGGFDVPAWIEKHGLGAEKEGAYKGGRRWVLSRCPFASNHSSADASGACVIQRASGTIGFKCGHHSCKGKGWKAVGEHYGETTAGKFDRYARAFVDAAVARGEHPLFTGGRMYFYAGCRYAECPELPMRVREFFKARGWSQSNNVIGNVVPIVQSLCWRDAGTVSAMPYWSGTGEPFGNTRDVIAFGNGLLDIGKPDAGLVPHSPDWCSTVCLPYNYDPAARCPLWLKFLDDVFEGDAERLLLLQEFFGYCLTQDTSLQKALGLVGKMRSGKGTIQRIGGALVGRDSATGFSLDRLVSDFGLSSLVGKTLALVGEVELQTNRDRAKIVETWKSIIGEDMVSVNEKHNPKFQSIRLPTRFIVASNGLPRLMDSSGAMVLC